MPSSFGYFDPSYFSPTYFGPLGAIAPGGRGSSMTAFRDRDAFAAILQALNATGEFAEVAFPAALDTSPVGASRTPLAVVVPVQWAEDPDASSMAMIRRVTYNLILVARAESPRDRFETLDRLTSIAQNALEGSTLGGFCMPPLSHLRRGQFDAHSRHPELRLAIEGGFSYLIDSPNGHNVAR
jgi:hypothetical protein